MKYLKSLGYVILFIIIQNYLYVLLRNITNNNIILSTFLTYLILISYFILKNRKDLKSDLKNIHFNKKYLIISLILTILSCTIHYLLIYLLKFDATNNVNVINSLKTNPLFNGISIILLAPIAEEFIYRYQFKEHNNVISFIIYTIFFTLIHMISTTSIEELLYFIPYLLVSLSISLQYFKNNNIFTSIIYHIFNNIINLMLLFI